MSNVKVSVVMAVYNGEAYLRDAIESILNQTFSDFEFIIINDCSTDNSLNIIESYKDCRIKLINNTCNMGLTKSLNIGIELSKGIYIARMDSDDISLQHRLEKQIEFMELNPQIQVVGSWVKFIGDCNDIWKTPKDSERIRCISLFNNAIAHPSVLIRASIFKENYFKYNEEFKKSQDYELWVRILNSGLRISNVQEVLLNYRIHDSQIGYNFKGEQVEFAERIRKYQLDNMKIDYSDRELEIHNLIAENYEITNSFLKECILWLNKLVQFNYSAKYFDKNYFKMTIEEYFLRILNNSSKNERNKIIFSLLKNMKKVMPISKLALLRYIIKIIILLYK